MDETVASHSRRSCSALFLAGTAMAGVGFGPAWTGAYRIIVAETSPQQRTGLAAAIFDVAYLFKAFPPMAGVATQRFGLHDTAVGWTALIACASLLQQSARASITADQANEAPAAHAPSPPPAPPPSHPPAASPATLKQHARHDDDAACSVQWFRG